MNTRRLLSALIAVTFLLTIIVPALAFPLEDVDDSYTKSLLHFDGADASTTITDESGKTWTAAGSAQLDTAQSKFGSASLLLDGNGDYVSTSDHSDFTLGSNSWTFDAWVQFNALPSASNTQAILGVLDDTNNYFYIGLYNNAGTYRWEIWHRSAGAFLVGLSKNTTLSTGQWYHVAFVRSGSTFYIFQDGTLVVSTATDADSIADLTSSFAVGQRGPSGGFSFNGWIDEFRFTNGVARWTSNFTPPSSQYEPTPTITPSPTNTAPPTATYTPTNTATDTPTNTPTDTPTNTPSPTATNTGTLTPGTATNTPTETITPTATNTPTDTPTPGPTATPVTPAYVIDPTITYGDYAVTLTVASLCLIVIIIAMVAFGLYLSQRKGRS